MHSRVCTGNANGTFTDHGVVIASQFAQGDIFRAGDFDGDGTRDILEIVVKNTSQKGNLYAYHSWGSYFQTQNPNPSGTGHTEDAPVYVGDFNGDGRDDVLEFVNGHPYVWLAVDCQYLGGAFSAKTYWGTGDTITMPSTDSNGIYHETVWPADVNGDGMVDVIAKDSGSSYFVWLSTGNGFRKVSWSFGHGTPTTQSILKTGDFNGDGKADVVEIYGGHLTVWAASGGSDAAFAADRNWLTATVTGRMEQIAVGDFNGDGRDDITDYAGRVFVSTGTAFTYLGQWGNWEGYQGQCIVGDLSGKGNRDVIWLDLVYVSAFAAKAQADLMTSVTNGIGNTVNIAYKSINSGDPYFYSGAGSYSYPTRMPYRGPMYVVQEVSRRNGVNGGFNRYLYTYEGVKIDLLRRRSLGFESIRMRDLQSRTDLITFYKTAFPYTGLVSQQQTIHYPTDAYTQGIVVRDVKYTYECEIYRSSQPLQPEIMDTLYKYWNDPTRHTSTYSPHIKWISTDVYDVVSGKKVFHTSTDMTYDPLGLIKTREESTTAYANDANNTHTTYSLNTINTYWPVDQANWDAWNFGLLYEIATSATNASGMLTRKTRYTDYDFQRRLLKTEEREPGGVQSAHLLTNYDYDGFGNVTTVSSIGWDGLVDNATRTTTYEHEYPPTADYSHVVTMRKRVNASVELVETKRYNPYFGSLDQVIDPNGLVASYTYDGFGRQTGEYLPDGTQTNKTYNHFLKGYYTLIVSSGKPNVVAFYDELDREIAAATTGFDSTRNILRHTTYNTLGLVETQSRPFYEGGTELVTRYSYNDLGRLEDTIAYDTGTTHHDYNQGDGMSMWVTNAKGQVSKTKLDAQGKVVTVKQKGDGITTTYTYDPFGNLLTVTDSNNKTTTMTYDILGRKLSQSDPDMGNWTYGYNAFGELITQTDAKGQTIAMEYDALGRLTHRAVYGGTVNTLLRFFGFSGTPDEETWRVYDTAPMGATPGKPALGMPAEIRGMNGYLKSLTYDDFGRVLTVTSRINGVSYQVATEYDQYGRIAAITYPNTGVSGYGPFKVRYGYTALGYLEKVYEDANPTKVYWRTTKMDDAERVTEEVFGEGFTTQLTRRHSFAADTARLANMNTTGAGMTFQNLSYTHDILGNVLTRSEAANPANVLTETFAYDELNRLKSSKMNNFWQTTTNYTYADNGNITYKTGIGWYFYASDRPHAMTASGTMKYDYDENGNMFEEYTKPLFGSKTVQRAFEYNADNMPVRVTKGSTALATMVYDPDNDLITQDITEGGVTTATVRIGDFYEKVATGTLTEHRHYIAAGGGLVAIRTIRSNATADTYYVLDDHLGSVSAIVRDATGQADNKMSFTPHGERRNPDTWLGDPPTITGLVTRRGFTGHVQLDAVGLIHMKGRFYDPMRGRFITPDPYVQAPYDSQSLNRYSYCLNNPMNLVDPSGFWSWRKFLHSVVTGVAAAVGFVLGAATGNPMMACFVLSGLFGGATAGCINGGKDGIVPGMLMGGSSALIGGIVCQGAAFISPDYGGMAITGAQIGYAYHRDGLDALGYMAGAMFAQGMTTMAFNKMGFQTIPYDAPGNIDGQRAPVPSESNSMEFQSMDRFTHDMYDPTQVKWTLSDTAKAFKVFDWADKIKSLFSLGGFAGDAQKLRDDICVQCSYYKSLEYEAASIGDPKLGMISEYKEYWCRQCYGGLYGTAKKGANEYTGK